MRFYDLQKVKRLLEALEEGKAPTQELLTEAREAVNREQKILVARKERYAEIRALAFYKHV